MTMRRVWVAIAFGVLGVAAGCLIWAVQSSLSAPLAGAAVDDLDSAYFDAGSHYDQQEALVNDLLDVRDSIESKRLSEEVLDHAVEGEVSSAIDADWERYPRTTFDLLTAFLDAGDKVVASQLVRHIVLNSLDIRLDAYFVEALDALVKSRSRDLSRLYQNYRSALHTEMVALVRSGRVAPMAVEQPDERSVSAVASVMARMPEVQKLSLTPTELRELVRERLPPPVSHIEVDGAYYAFSSFPEMVTDKMFEEIKFFAAEFLSEIAGCFFAQGCADEAVLSAQIDGIQSFSAVRRRREHR